VCVCVRLCVYLWARASGSMGFYLLQLARKELRIVMKNVSKTLHVSQTLHVGDINHAPEVEGGRGR
jgi:hypothetical protein